MRDRTLSKLPWGKLRSMSQSALAVVFLLTLCGSAIAFEIPTSNENLGLRWDNTLRYTYGFRTESADAHYLNNPNADDGDRNFDKGTITNRLDLLSEFDVVYKKNYGVRFSAAAWYDQRYHDPMGNDSPSTSNHLVNGSQTTGLSDYTKTRFAGPAAELLDAFAFASFNLGPVPVSLKVGRHTVYWGEAFLGVGGNQISYSQMPIDVGKAFANPGSELKELFRPLGCITAQAQVSNTVSISAQQFFEWEAYQLPESGSFLSLSDALLKGGDSLIVVPGVWTASHNQNLEKDLQESGTKNWGAAVRWSPDWLGGTMGFFYRRFTDMNPSQLNIILGMTPLSAVLPLPTQYFLTYGSGIDLYGMSLSTKVFGLSLGAEVSYRHNMPLSSSPAVIFPGLIGAIPAKGETTAAVGNTWHGVLNLMGLGGTNPLWDSYSWLAEVGVTRLDKINSDNWTADGATVGVYKGRAAYGNLVDRPTDTAVGFGLNFTPTWFQVFPGMDLGMPLTFNYGVYGVSCVAGGSAEHDGNWSAGLSLTIYEKYIVTANYAAYFGELSNEGLAGGTNALIRDRNNVTLTIKTTF